MSERRCGVHSDVEYCDGGTGCSYREPQEGASRNAVPSNAGGHTCPGDAPSCDSAELAAIRALLSNPKQRWRAVELAAQALLRMVDELRAENESWREAIKGNGGWNDMVLELREDVRLYKSMFEAADADCDAYIVELDETRAKLAEAEHWRLIHKNTVYKLEAKLAEAKAFVQDKELRHADTVRALGARLKELERK